MNITKLITIKKTLEALISIISADIEDIPDYLSIFKNRSSEILKKQINWAFSQIKNKMPKSPVGIVTITKKGIRASLFKGANKYKASLYPVLDKLIENSILLFINHEANNKHQYILGSKFSRKEDIGYVGIVIKEDKEGKKYYSHTIYQKNSWAAKSGSGDQNLTLRLHPAVNNILHEILTVNKKQSG